MAAFQASAIVAGELAILFVGATLPSPLYPLYQKAFGFGGITLTLIYAVYVLGNLAALLFFGPLSDRIGRRRAIMPSIGLAVASTLAFLVVTSTAWLFAARILSGLATGLGSGTATAWLADLQPHRDKSGGSMIATAANFLGIAAGPLLAGVLAQTAPVPLRLPYLIYGALLLIALAALWAAPETVKPASVGRGTIMLRPRLGVPKRIRREFLPPAVAAFVTFALIGFYAALLPSLLHDSLGVTAPVVSGAVICALFVIAAIAAAITTNLAARTAMLGGLVLLLPSLALVIAAELLHSMGLLWTATACAGIAAALGYRGSLQVVNEIAPAEQRAEVVSSYLIAVYLGNSLPVVGVGLLAALIGSVAADVVFAAAIAALAVAALIGKRGAAAALEPAE